jgi:hypothetical protein
LRIDLVRSKSQCVARCEASSRKEIKKSRRGVQIKVGLARHAAAGAKKGISDAVVAPLVVSSWCNSLGLDHSVIRAHFSSAATMV